MGSLVPVAVHNSTYGLSLCSCRLTFEIQSPPTISIIIAMGGKNVAPSCRMQGIHHAQISLGAGNTTSGALQNFL